jgi:hypothetical protein
MELNNIPNSCNTYPNLRQKIRKKIGIRSAPNRYPYDVLLYSPRILEFGKCKL